LWQADLLLLLLSIMGRVNEMGLEREIGKWTIGPDE